MRFPNAIVAGLAACVLAGCGSQKADSITQVVSEVMQRPDDLYYDADEGVKCFYRGGLVYVERRDHSRITLSAKVVLLDFPEHAATNKSLDSDDILIIQLSDSRTGQLLCRIDDFGANGYSRSEGDLVQLYSNAGEPVDQYFMTADAQRQMYLRYMEKIAEQIRKGFSSEKNLFRI